MDHRSEDSPAAIPATPSALPAAPTAIPASPPASPRALPAPPIPDLADAAAAVTGVPVVESLWVVDQLSRVVAFRLADGAEVVAKARPSEPRLSACARAQATAVDRGFPCPRPLGAREVGVWTVGIEEHRPGGRPHTVEELGVQVFVDLFLSLDDAVGDLAGDGASEIVGGRPQPVPPPWGDPLHDGADVWPERDVRLPDLRTDASVPWLREAAEGVRRRVAAVPGPLRVGHLDFETHNMRWGEAAAGAGPLDRLVSLDDWDSLGALPEILLVGQAAGTYTSTRESGTAPTVPQSQEFLDRWLAAAGRTWGREEWEVAWAAGLWTVLFNIQDRVVHRDVAGSLERPSADLAERLRRAGI